MGRSEGSLTPVLEGFNRSPSRVIAGVHGDTVQDSKGRIRSERGLGDEFGLFEPILTGFRSLWGIEGEAGRLRAWNTISPSIFAWPAEASGPCLVGAVPSGVVGAGESLGNSLSSVSLRVVGSSASRGCGTCSGFSRSLSHPVATESTVMESRLHRNGCRGVLCLDLVLSGRDGSLRRCSVSGTDLSVDSPGGGGKACGQGPEHGPAGPQDRHLHGGRPRLYPVSGF